jgi:putative ABC transport system ATP-binding protein
MIEAEDVSKIHQQGARGIHALNRVSIRIAAGEYVAIMGPSGSGKSTLLQLLGGLDVPTSGRVIFRGRDLATIGDRERSLLRRREIGFVFQSFNLVPTLTSAENVVLPLLLDGFKRRIALRRGLEALEKLGMSERATHFPEELSGGEMQRVAIARALVVGPSLLLCDEPTGSVDSAAGLEVRNLLLGVTEPSLRSVVVVTHDSSVASDADRVVRIVDGRIASEKGTRGIHAGFLPYA